MKQNRPARPQNRYTYDRLSPGMIDVQTSERTQPFEHETETTIEMSSTLYFFYLFLYCSAVQHYLFPFFSNHCDRHHGQEYSFQVQEEGAVRIPQHHWQCKCCCWHTYIVLCQRRGAATTTTTAVSFLTLGNTVIPVSFFFFCNDSRILLGFLSKEHGQGPRKDEGLLGETDHIDGFVGTVVERTTYFHSRRRR